MADIDGGSADIVSDFGFSGFTPGVHGRAVDGYSLSIESTPCPPFPTPPPIVFVQTTGPRISAATALGGGIVRPFRRTEHQDFANDSGVAEVLSCIGQVLGTELGSLPWRVDFGAGLQRLRHRNNTNDFVELARVLIDDAIRKWEPRAQLHDVQTDPNPPAGALGLEISLGIGGQIKTLRL